MGPGSRPNRVLTDCAVLGNPDSPRGGRAWLGCNDRWNGTWRLALGPRQRDVPGGVGCSCYKETQQRSEKNIPATHDRYPARWKTFPHIVLPIGTRHQETGDHNVPQPAAAPVGT